MQDFSNSQMYEMFIKELEEMSKNKTLELCPISKEKFSQVNMKTMYVEFSENFLCFFSSYNIS